jgi:hypothetical protein
LAVIVIQSSRFTVLMAGAGGAELLAPGAGTALRPAVALAAVTVPAEEEVGLAVAALEFEQDDVFAMTRTWHAAAQVLDNSKPFLSP